MSHFHIRDVGVVPEDGQFIAEAFDSALPHLASIGSGAQWGSQISSERPDLTKRINNWVESSEKYRLTGEGDPIRLFICEVEMGPAIASVADGLRYRTDNNGKQFLSVGAAVVHDNWFPEYVESQAHIRPTLTEAKEKGDFMFLELMITDFRTKSFRKGAGAALTQKVKQYVLEKGKKALFVDCWAGNERKLVRFYEMQGFRVVDDFSVKKPDGTTWPGAFSRMGLADEA